MILIPWFSSGLHNFLSLRSKYPPELCSQTPSINVMMAAARAARQQERQTNLQCQKHIFHVDESLEGMS
jgi:hypothetical protein